jgi:hypothetical protein
MNPEEHREEAERLARLPLADQNEILALHRSVADNPKVPKKDREAARARVDALAKELARLRRKRL